MPPQASPADEARPPRAALAWIAAGIALTSAGHYLVSPDFLLWHALFQRLYYLPVVLAALFFGWRGGIAAAAVSAALYLPHIVKDWAHLHHYALEQYAEIVMLFAVGLVTGILADRERARRRELHRVYSELQSSFEQVKRADRLSAIGQLAAGLAHEIRNPLASIDGAAELLEGGAEGEVRKETVNIIRHEGARLNRLLSNLLDFARPRPPAREPIDIAAVIENVRDLVRHSAGKNIQFHTRLAPSLPKLSGDREQLAQVLLNLLLNAAQAMPQGGAVTISAQPANGGILIEVADEGPGIPPDAMDKIFDPFFTTKDTGTGLGLSVVHQIVTQHGGTVSARPHNGKGAVFSLTFPAKVKA